jgi:hypothetical protein
MKKVENEGYVTEFLYDNGIKVARLLKTKCNEYLVKTNELQFHIQDFIEGETYAVNSAPNWFIEKSAQILGEINHTLKGFRDLPVSFGKDFFSVTTVNNSKQHYINELQKAKESGDNSLVIELEEQLKHLNRISKFSFDVDKLTYTNSHGDFYIGQTIAKNKEITVIDWTSACRLPVCLEIITSYSYADPLCKDGVIDINGLKKYLSQYLKYFTLNEYDIKMMPYLFYFQQCICNYSPPYDNMADNYKAISKLILNLLNWLYDNVEDLSYYLQGYTAI